MPKSLRLQLLGWVLVPLGLLVSVNTWISFRNASETATVVQDRMLLGAVRIIAEQTYYKSGELHVEVPPAALELFESSSPDRVYYRVATSRGTLLLGYPELPSPPISLRAEEVTHFDSAVRGQPVRVAALAQPVVGAPDPDPVLIEVAQTLQSHRALATQIWKQAIRQQLVMLGLAIILVWLGLHWGLRPLIRLRDAVLERRPGVLEPLDPGPVPQELAPLVGAMNEYVRRLDEHMAAHGRFVAYASHQLRTALTVLNTQVSFALRSEDAAVRHDALQAIRDGVRHGIRLVNQLLTLFMAEAGAHGQPRHTQVDLAEVVKRVLEELAMLAQSKSIDLGFEQQGCAIVRGTPSMLHELVANLVDNAIRYTPAGGTVTAAVAADAERVTLRIEDNGPGIPAEQRERVFERFYRLHDDASGGCGLGLPIVREIAMASLAKVALSDPPGGRGLVVSVTFA
jgi:two-component system, OmpR family, sensor histidine kinase TctE